MSTHQELEVKAKFYYQLAVDEPNVCHMVNIMKDICGCEDDMTFNQYNQFHAFEHVYKAYARKQDDQRLNDLRRYDWVISKLPIVLKDKDKVRKFKHYYNKHVFSMLFDDYYKIDKHPYPRLQILQTKLDDIDTVIYNAVYNALQYKKIIELETVDKPCMQLFLLLWKQWDANKIIDIMALPLIEDVQKLIRQSVLRN